MRKLLAVILAISLLAIFSLTTVRSAEEEAKEVTKALWTFQDFQQDPAMGWFRNNLHRAKGILIMPLLVKMGFIGGFYAGNGVLLAQDEKGQWSYPAFYNMAAATFGFQAGAVGGQVMFMIMSDKGLSTFMANKFQLGADASIGVGPVGIGAKAELFDIYSFSRIKGLFAGITLDGGGVTVNNEANRAYYDQANISPDDILILRKFENQQANPLIAEVTKAASFVPTQEVATSTSEVAMPAPVAAAPAP